ncbi:MAG TPA: hypothetical protein VJ992_06265 [Gemmatimonadales bacterium]|nr:hypothetical protein [Gemmatimonadales bacterium]
MRVSHLLLAVALAVGVSGTARAQSIPRAALQRVAVRPRPAIRPRHLSSAQMLRRLQTLPGSRELLQRAGPTVRSVSSMSSGTLTLDAPSMTASGAVSARLSLFAVDVHPGSSGGAYAALDPTDEGLHVQLAMTPAGSGSQTYAVFFDFSARGGSWDQGTRDGGVLTMPPGFPTPGSVAQVATCTNQTMTASTDASGIMTCPAVVTLPAGRETEVVFGWPGAGEVEFVDVSFLRIR